MRIARSELKITSMIAAAIGRYIRTIMIALLYCTWSSWSLADQALPSYERVRVLHAPRTIADAELTNQYGEPYRLSDLEGKVALIFFGFTNCPDVCPTTMAKFRLLQDSGEVNDENVAFVLISVDGERDTPDVLKTYLAKFSAQFIGLTGDMKKVRLIAKEFSAAFFKENPTAPGGNYDVSHSPQAFVLDPEGQLRAEFYSPSVSSMAGIVNALLEPANDDSPPGSD